MEAYDRIAKALAGKPVGLVDVAIGEDDHGDPVYGKAQYTVQVLAGDSFAVASLIPKDKRSAVARDLRKGTARLAPDRVVRQQTSCLTTLLAEARPYLPADPAGVKPADEPADDLAGDKPAGPDPVPAEPPAAGADFPGVAGPA